MKKFFIVFSIFCLFILTSCSKYDDEDIFPADTGADTSDTGTSGNDITNTDTANTDISNTDISNTDTANTNPDTPDTDIPDNDTANTNPDTPDTDIPDNDTTDTDIPDNDTPDTDIPDNDTTDTDIPDNDTPDTDIPDNDTPDTDIPDNDTTDTDIPDNDTTDTDIPDNDTTDTDTGLDELPECSKDSGTPCKLEDDVWSSKEGAKNWDDAVAHCNNLREGGYNWELPSIDQLRTLIKNCTPTEPEGSCHVTDACSYYLTGGCFDDNKCNNPLECPNYYEHSLFGDTGEFWSSSSLKDFPDEKAWKVDFSYGLINFKEKSDAINVRCVRKAED